MYELKKDYSKTKYRVNNLKRWKKNTSKKYEIAIQNNQKMQSSGPSNLSSDEIFIE